MKKSLFVAFTLLIFISKTTSQTEYPQDYFKSPLDIPIILSGTFGELRTAHFHSGMDFKTQQREGLKVYASAEGYVSRIKISNWGYGKALYITHPNGYTTVYAHLKKFNPQIEAYLREKQYQQENATIQLFPKKDELLVTSQEVVAYSGSTGGFVGPHLHFEIRDSKTEKTINPMHFGFVPKDTKVPVINHLRAYTFNDSSHVNLSNVEIPLVMKQLNTGIYKADKITAYGKIGFAINTYDRQDGALNKNGIYKLEMFVNGKRTFEHKVETFAFSESKYINLLIDYPFYATRKRKYQKTYIHPESKLSTYNRNLGEGYLIIEPNQNYQTIIRVTDFIGNKSELTIPIIGLKQIPEVTKTKTKTPYFVDKDEAKSIQLENIKIAFKKNTFYDDIYLNIEKKNNVISIHKPIVPLHKSYSISFNVSNYSEEERKHLYIAQVSKGKKLSYRSTTKKDSIFKTTTRKLGSYTLGLDSIAPVINKCSFYENQNLSKYRYLSIRVTDRKTGLKSYRGEIDGQWIRLELNVKTNKLTFDFNDINLTKGKHTFKLIAMDNVGNTRTFTSSFQLK